MGRENLLKLASRSFGRGWRSARAGGSSDKVGARMTKIIELARHLRYADYIAEMEVEREGRAIVITVPESVPHEAAMFLAAEMYRAVNRMRAAWMLSLSEHAKAKVEK